MDISIKTNKGIIKLTDIANVETAIELIYTSGVCGQQEAVIPTPVLPYVAKDDENGELHVSGMSTETQVMPEINSETSNKHFAEDMAKAMKENAKKWES